MERLIKHGKGIQRFFVLSHHETLLVSLFTAFSGRPEQRSKLYYPAFWLVLRARPTYCNRRVFARQNQAGSATHPSREVRLPHRPLSIQCRPCSSSIPARWSIQAGSLDSRLSGSYTPYRYCPTVCLREQHGTEGYNTERVSHKRAARRCRSQRQWVPTTNFTSTPLSSCNETHSTFNKFERRKPTDRSDEIRNSIRGRKRS